MVLLGLVDVMLHLIFIWKVDSKVKGGLSVSHTNVLDIVQRYKSRGWQGELNMMFNSGATELCEEVSLRMQNTSRLLAYVMLVYLMCLDMHPHKPPFWPLADLCSFIFHDLNDPFILGGNLTKSISVSQSTFFKVSNNFTYFNKISLTLATPVLLSLYLEFSRISIPSLPVSLASWLLYFQKR